MKIIEAMKKVKANKEKIADLQKNIESISAHLSFETPKYPDSKKMLEGWAQACDDIVQENIRLLVAIQCTNLATQVTITLGEKNVSKSIAEWIWRRREYHHIDYGTWSKMSDRGLKEGSAPSSTGQQIEIKIVRYYDPEKRDKMLAMYRSEKHEIDGALEVINATTDLIEA